MALKSLILITAGFPFGESEQSFLRAEFDELVKHYRITIMTTKDDEPVKYPIPEDVRIEQYCYQRNGGWRLPISILNLLRLLLKAHVRKELRMASRGCSFQLKRRRFMDILFFALQAEQLKSVLIPLIEQTGASVIYSYWCFPITMAAGELKKRYPLLSVVTRFHGYDLYKERQANGWQPFREQIAEKCDQLVFACEKGRDYYLSQWGCQWADKAMVSYLGCRPMKRICTDATERLSLVSCSNVIPLKRIYLIVEALMNLPENIAVDWHHIGDGATLVNVKQLAQKSLSGKQNVRWKFWGYIPNSQLEEVYQQIQPQLFITTSATEGGAPVSIQEIFAAGVPAIGTAVGGIPELIRDNETGYLLAENPTSDDIVSAITAFYFADQEQKQKMKESAFLLWRDKLSAQSNAEKFVAYLKSLS